MGVMEILKEITSWDCEYRVPNHTYLIDNKGRVIAYATEQDEVVKLKTGFIIDKRYRKFIKVEHPGLAEFITPEERELKQQKVVKSENVRVFKVKSKGREYIVQYNVLGDFYNCACIGFGYRAKCKHIDSVRQFIK